jgi:hypothetical protein
MDLTGRGIKYFLESWWLVGWGSFTVWVSLSSFQKSSIGWPQQPQTEKGLKFNVIFHDSTQNFFFSKHPNKAESNDMDDPEVLSSDFSGLWTFAASMTSTASTTSMASYHQTFTDPDSWIIPGTKMTNIYRFLWNKSQFFTNIWYNLCRRLLRPAMLLFWEPVDKTQTSWTH